MLPIRPGEVASSSFVFRVVIARRFAVTAAVMFDKSRLGASVLSAANASRFLTSLTRFRGWLESGN